METVYKKKELASEVLMDYYAHCELRSFIREDWEKEDAKWEKQCNSLYEKYETLHEEERKRKASKSAKIAKKLEALKNIKPDYGDTVLLKKLKNAKP